MLGMKCNHYIRASILHGNVIVNFLNLTLCEALCADVHNTQFENILKLEFYSEGRSF